MAFALSWRTGLALLCALLLDIATRLNISRPRLAELIGFEPATWAVILLVAWTRSWWATIAGAVVLLGLRTFAIAEHGCRHFLRRPVALVNDVRLVPDLQELLTNTGGPNTLGYVAIALAVYLLLSAALLRGVAGQAPAVGGLATVSLLGTLIVGQPVTLSVRAVEEVVALAFVGDFESRVALEHAEVIDTWNDIPREFRRRDLHVLIVESYGETVFRHEPYKTLREERIPWFAAKLAESGLKIRSRYYRSPTFGGRSWFAHSAIAAGLMVGDSDRYRMLLDSEVEPLASHFRRGGYRTTLVAPAITRAWPEADYFGFENVLVFASLGYTGPRFGFAMVPDQWVIHRVRNRLGPGPHLVEWHLTSTHAPFTAHAPVLDDDALAAANPYEGLEAKRFKIRWPDLENAEVGYAWAMDYEFQVLADAIPRLLAEGGLAVVVGDHQPNGALTEDDASWNVPCHVIGRELDGWPGYSAGVIPSGDAAPLSQLFVDILESESVSVGPQTNLGAPR